MTEPATAASEPRPWACGPTCDDECHDPSWADTQPAAGDPPLMVDQVKWAIEHRAAIDATKMLLRHAVNCTLGDLCPTCRAIKEAVNGT